MKKYWDITMEQNFAGFGYIFYLEILNKYQAVKVSDLFLHESMRNDGLRAILDVLLRSFTGPKPSIEEVLKGFLRKYPEWWKEEKVSKKKTSPKFYKYSLTLIARD